MPSNAHCGAGPSARTVREPAAIWVWPASICRERHTAWEDRGGGEFRRKRCWPSRLLPTRACLGTIGRGRRGTTL